MIESKKMYIVSQSVYIILIIIDSHGLSLKRKKHKLSYHLLSVNIFLENKYIFVLPIDYLIFWSLLIHIICDGKTNFN